MSFASSTPLILSEVAAQAEVGAGKIQGGWEYVWAAYLVFWLALALYAGALLTRRANAARQEGEG